MADSEANTKRLHFYDKPKANKNLDEVVIPSDMTEDQAQKIIGN